MSEAQKIETQVMYYEAKATKARAMAAQSTDNPRARKAWAKAAKAHAAKARKLAKSL